MVFKFINTSECFYTLFLEKNVGKEINVFTSTLFPEISVLLEVYCYGHRYITEAPSQDWDISWIRCKPQKRDPKSEPWGTPRVENKLKSYKIGEELKVNWGSKLNVRNKQMGDFKAQTVQQNVSDIDWKK